MSPGRDWVTPMTSMQRRLARLTSIYGESCPRLEQRLREEIAQMSPEERRERLRSLVLKLMRVRNIRPVEPESFADAAVRAVATTQLKSPAWESVIRRVFQKNTELTAENSATEIQSRLHFSSRIASGLSLQTSHGSCHEHPKTA